MNSTLQCNLTWLSFVLLQALIELPPEFAPQLPREGGAFFVNEAKEVVRSYYKASWPSILHASSICVTTLPDLRLKEDVSSEDQGQKAERFFLILGILHDLLIWECVT